MLLEFIKENRNWREVLSKEPYNLKFDEKDNLVLFKYNQLGSDFSLKLVRESRGCIIDINTFEYVCRPFVKFFNVQEEFASKIDWESARVQTKLDGSIIKVWYYNNKWNVSTNGTINSSEARISNDLYTFYELFILSGGNNLPYEIMGKNRTYIFELTSPFQKIVTPYKEHKLFHIGTIDNRTGEEFNEDIGIEKPKEFRCSDKNELIQATELMPFTEEGYVVVDKHWNRVKIKSPAYVKAHRLITGTITKKKIIELILMNEQSEFLVYYPEYIKEFLELESLLNKLINKVTNKVLYLLDYKELNRKEFSSRCLKTTIPIIGFKFYEGKYINIQQYIKRLEINKLLALLESNA